MWPKQSLGLLFLFCRPQLPGNFPPLHTKTKFSIFYTALTYFQSFNGPILKDTYGCAPQIPEATRVDIILKGVAECERFSMVDHLFSTYDIEDKSLVEVIRVLGNIEASSGGQDKLTNEIKEVSNKRKRDDNNGDNSKANLTIKKFISRLVLR